MGKNRLNSVIFDNLVPHFNTAQRRTDLFSVEISCLPDTAKHENTSIFKTVVVTLLEFRVQSQLAH
jgi:hypothetical protein